MVVNGLVQYLPDCLDFFESFFSVTVSEFQKYMEQYAKVALEVSPSLDESQDDGDGDADTFDMNSQLEPKTIGELTQEDKSHPDHTVSTAKDTKTSTGDDFSESLLPAQEAITMLSAQELDSLRQELQELHTLLQSERHHGVYPHASSHRLLSSRLLSKKYYEQTNAPFLTDPHEIAETFLAEYYHTLDHDLTSTRAVSRFYETESSINFGGVPDIVPRRKISRALVVSGSLSSHPFTRSVLFSSVL
jgi:hypothetical protein